MTKEQNLGPIKTWIDRQKQAADLRQQQWEQEEVESQQRQQEYREREREHAASIVDAFNDGEFVSADALRQYRQELRIFFHSQNTHFAPGPATEKMRVISLENGLDIDPHPSNTCWGTRIEIYRDHQTEKPDILIESDQNGNNPEWSYYDPLTGRYTKPEKRYGHHIQLTQPDVYTKIVLSDEDCCMVIYADKNGIRLALDESNPETQTPGSYPGDIFRTLYYPKIFS